jgi:hypothetical protein
VDTPDRLRDVSETTTPRPIPEARPPHLPDAVTRQSPWLLFFAVVLILQVWRATQLFDPLINGADPGAALSYVLSWTSSITAPVLGLALFWRHPDARRTMPLLVFGLLLLAVGELLDVFSDPIGRFLSGVTPETDTDTFAQAPALFAFRLFTSLLAVFGLLYLGAGLSSARSRDRSTAERPLAIWLGALAIVSTVLSFLVLTGLPAEATPMLVVQVILGTVLSALVTLGWAYVATVTIGGWVAGETPKQAWALAAIGASALFGLRLIFAVLDLLTLSVDAQPFVFVIIPLVSYAGWLLLAAAFVLGLPTPSSAVEDSSPMADRPVATPPGSGAG